jgi:hypothetical protein
MNGMRKHIAIAAALAGAAFIYATPASAQATRTWVSGVGDDVNPCSRTAPCKTFAGAISKTAAGGEINCLDPAGYGAVTINKSLVIDCHYTEGGALAGGNGIVVNLPATTDAVTIRGLDIFGVNPPTNGVRMIGQGSLHIEDCVIRRFNAASSRGVSFQPSGTANLFITNTTITENGNGATGGGILIGPTGAGGNSRVTIKNVIVANNANQGILVDTTGNTAAFGNIVVVDGSMFSNNNNNVVVNTPAATTTAALMLQRSVVTNGAGTGVLATGATATIRVGATVISGNGTGVSFSGGAVINTYGDNVNDGNGSPGAFQLPALQHQ